MKSINISGHWPNGPATATATRHVQHPAAPHSTKPRTLSIHTISAPETPKIAPKPASGKIQVRTFDRHKYKYPDTTAPPVTPSSYLIDAARWGNLPQVTEYITKGGVEVDAPAETDLGTSALIEAAAAPHLDVVHALLHLGADVNLADARERTALYWAVSHDMSDLVDTLLEQGALVNVPALVAAIECGRRSLFKKLLERAVSAGLNLNLADRSGNTVLSMAIRRADYDSMRDLIDAGADVDAKAYFDDLGPIHAELRWGTPLCVAVACNDRAAAGILIEAGADIGAMGNHAMYTAAVLGKAELAQLMVMMGARADDTVLVSVMHHCNSHAEPINLLISAGANVNAILTEEASISYGDGAVHTPLSIAAQNGYTEIVQALLKAGAEVDTEVEDGNTALLLAVDGRHLETAAVLVQGGADVRCKNARGESAMDLIIKELQWAEDDEDGITPEYAEWAGALRETLL